MVLPWAHCCKAYCGPVSRTCGGNLIFAGDFDLNLPVGVCGASRRGIVAQPVLRTQLAVDAIENTVHSLASLGRT